MSWEQSEYQTASDPIYTAEQEINFVTFSNQQTDVPVLEHLHWQYQKE